MYRNIKIYAEAERQIVSSSGRILSSREETEEFALMRLTSEAFQEIRASPESERADAYRKWVRSNIAECASSLGRGELEGHLAQFNRFLTYHEGWDITWVEV